MLENRANSNIDFLQPTLNIATVYDKNNQTLANEEATTKPNNELVFHPHQKMEMDILIGTFLDRITDLGKIHNCLS
jgi:hypothetical protein